MTTRELNKKPQPTEEQLIKKLWEKGDLRFLLRGNQHKVKQVLLDGVKKDDGEIFTILCSRRFGKSFILTCWAYEVCMKTPRAVVKYACPTKKQVQEIITKNIPIIEEHCPPHLKPEWMEAKGLLKFPNGSEIQIAAVNNKNAEALRGGYAHLCIVDEAGFVDELDYVVDSVLGPTTDTTGGNIVLASTPNYKNPAHIFHTEYVIPRIQEGTLIKFTVFESPFWNEKLEQRLRKRYGDFENPKFKCEYLCEFAIDRTEMVAHTFNDDVKLDAIIDSYERPAYYDAYVSGDPAAKDLTGLLFGYWDYYQKCLVIEDEATLGGEDENVTTTEIADAVKRKERKLWKDVTGAPIKPYKRIMDNNNPILINDLRADHGLMFTATAKDNKDAVVDKMCRMLREGKIKISSRCKQLLFQLDSTKWKFRKDGERTNDFARVKTKRGNAQGLKSHHGDLVDALLYLIRNITESHNPYPAGYDLPDHDRYFISGDRPQSERSRVASSMNLGKKKKKPSKITRLGRFNN